MRVTDVRLGSLLYAVTADEIRGLYRDPEGATTHFAVGPTARLAPLMDALRSELGNAMNVASGDVPGLHAFADEWGRGFLPDGFDPESLDALVVVPHALTHYLPMHLIRLPGREGCLGGMVALTYCSSRSIFQRCVSRNPARGQDLGAWRFAEAEPPRRALAPQSVVAGGCDVIAGQDDAFLAICRELAGLLPGESTVFGETGIGYSRNAAKAVFRLTPPRDVMLVMAHGFIDSRNHQFSGLLMWRDLGVALRTLPVQGERYFDFRDLPLRRFPPEIPTTAAAEVLTAAELELDAPLETQLVVLLGCSAGFGRVRQGDEPASLAETFLRVGAPSVVAPQWDSDIDAAADWARHFLAGWVRDGLPKAFAAREAYRKTETTFNGHPEKFGVMALRGDWL